MNRVDLLVGPQFWKRWRRPLGLALFLTIACLAGIATAQGQTAATATKGDKKPNILVIWGDDIGIENISYNSHGVMGYQTPNIDRIANEGAAFTDYYAQQSCTAGRAAFISGSVPVRSGMTKVGLPGAKEGWKKVDWVMIGRKDTEDAYPTATDALTNLGLLLIEQEEYDEAESLLHQAELLLREALTKQQATFEGNAALSEPQTRLGFVLSESAWLNRMAADDASASAKAIDGVLHLDRKTALALSKMRFMSHGRVGSLAFAPSLLEPANP